jgi:hypothetical protein
MGMKSSDERALINIRYEAVVDADMTQSRSLSSPHILVLSGLLLMDFGRSKASVYNCKEVCRKRSKMVIGQLCTAGLKTSGQISR